MIAPPLLQAVTVSSQRIITHHPYRAQTEMVAPLQFQPRWSESQVTMGLGTSAVRAEALMACWPKKRRMRMQLEVSRQTLGHNSAEQWQARIDLAAAHRLA
jgi:hypothetical protein